MKRIIFLGVGGNSHGPYLAGMFVVNRYPDAQLLIVDGKEYKKGHEDHEFFLRPGPKPHVQALLLHSAYPALTVVPVCKFVDRTTTEHTIAVHDLLQDGDYVVMVVDNHETRRLVAQHATTLRNITLISGAIDGNDVGIWLYLRRDGHDLTTSPLDRYPDIARANDKLPDEMFRRPGCLETGLTHQHSAERPNYFALLTTTTLTLNALWHIMILDETGRTHEFPYVDVWHDVATATSTTTRRA